MARSALVEFSDCTSGATNRPLLLAMRSKLARGTCVPKVIRRRFDQIGAVPPIGRGNESVAETLSEIDMDKSTERQLMTDMSGLDVWRGSRF